MALVSHSLKIRKVMLAVRSGEGRKGKNEDKKDTVDVALGQAAECVEMFFGCIVLGWLVTGVPTL